MRNGRILEPNLARTQVAHSDPMSKLRKANALRPSEVRAVVMEATGDASVPHGRREGYGEPLLADVVVQ